jgi:hypothetical protein
VPYPGGPGAPPHALACPAAFPGEGFGIGFPEAIGDAARAHWPPGLTVDWRRTEDGRWEQIGRAEGELSYSLVVTPHEDCLDIHQTLTNESPRTWTQSLAFNCFQCGGAPSIRDHDCLRHWVGQEGKPARLAEVPRAFGPRPTIQLYSVEGAPPGSQIPTASKPALFLFQNMEYSCIHAAASFGPLDPGQSGQALTRLYFVRASLEDWYARMRSELG